MTLEEMRAARAKGESLTDWERIRREVREDAEPEADEDSPDALALMRVAVAQRRADHISEGSNIAYDGHSLLIDANGDGQFQAVQDLSIDIVGVHKVAVDAGGTFLSVG